MTVEKEHLDLIEEIKQHDDKLTDWERGFIFGTDESSPISERTSLSISQKATIARIYRERVEGRDRSQETEIKFDSDRVLATKLETNAFKVAIDNEQIGPEVSHKEGVAVVGWLSEVIDTLKPPAGFPGE